MKSLYCDANNGEQKYLVSMAVSLGIDVNTFTIERVSAYRDGDTNSHRDNTGLDLGTDGCLGGSYFNEAKQRKISIPEMIKAMFDMAATKPKISRVAGYDIKYGSDSIILGCQTVTRAQIEGILEHMNKLKKQ